MTLQAEHSYLRWAENSNEFSIIIAAANASPFIRPRADSQKQAWRRRRHRWGHIAKPQSDDVTLLVE